ncbi:hypothetical protein [Nocardia yamanashiensis]|uniref:hypothetical protein n=1 Tax=Nocardia yamanashiensis TaxID=209247 RepID=UPI00082D3628|nr:hypothetical protein [Nocardia yamanashiensis]
MNGLTTAQWWVRSAVFVLIAVWRIYQTGRRPSLPSALITTALLATAANLVLESMAHTENQEPGGRPFVLAAVQALVLLIAWCATCAYYAHSDATTRAWRISVALTGFAALSAVAVITAGTAVPAGTALTDFAAVEVARYYSFVFAFFPLAQAICGYLATRTARRAQGPLRAAMTLAAVSLWALAAAGIAFIADVWIQHAGQQAPAVYTVGERLLYLAGTVGWVVSFGAVAAAHRSRQLVSLWRAIGENRLLRELLHTLEAVSPSALAYPRTGRTPLLLRPHAALSRTRIECRDRLVTISPQLSEDLDAEGCQSPERVAAALNRLRRDPDRTEAIAPVRPVGLLTIESPGTDPLIELARSYRLVQHR